MSMPSSTPMSTSSSSSHSSDFFDSHGDPECCQLARPDNECPHDPKNPSGYTCPSGEYATSWTCCTGNQMVGCGECSGGTNCYAGPWSCSIWWYVGTAC
jgi:hypothetical protein